MSWITHDFFDKSFGSYESFCNFASADESSFSLVGEQLMCAARPRGWADYY